MWRLSRTLYLSQKRSWIWDQQIQKMSPAWIWKQGDSGKGGRQHSLMYVLCMSTPRARINNQPPLFSEIMSRPRSESTCSEVENGSFTPLVFGTNGGMGKECDVFISTLASKIASKESEKYYATITWIRTRLSFEILRSAITCVRGSRVPFRKKIQEIADFELMNIQSNTRPI